jgi:hypothetical protein
MSKIRTTINLVLLTLVVLGQLIAIDAVQKMAVNSESATLAILNNCVGIREIKVKSGILSNDIEGTCAENTMLLIDMKKGRDDT